MNLKETEDKENRLTVIERREIEFYGDRVLAVRVEEGEVYVPIRPICDLIGVSWPAQFRRINRDAVLSRRKSTVAVTATDGKERELLCLPLDYLNGWLFGLNASRVDESVRDQLVRYQDECYRVLADAFMRDRVTARPDDELMESNAPSAIAYRNAMAVANLARQQYYIEQRLDATEERISAIEARLSDPKRILTTDQARRIADGVQTVAHELGKRSGRNEYAGVYNELYRRFEVPDYRSLPSAKFDECMDWLRQWYQSLTGIDVPF